MNNYLIFLGLFFFAITAVLRRDLALYLVILLLPSYQIRFQVFGIPGTFLEGMILILAARSLFPLPSWEKIKVRGNKITNLFILLFLLAAFIAVFTAPNLIKAAGIFKAYFFEAILFYFLTLLLIDTPEKLKRLFKTLALLVLYLSIFGLYQFLTLYGLPYNWWAVDVESRRIISALNHPNALALLLGPILAMLIMLPNKTKLYWSAIILGIVTLYLSFSRAAWLALIVTIVGTIFIAKLFARNPPSPPLKVRGGWGALLSSVIVISLLVLAIPFSRAKILDLLRGQDLAQQNRIVLWSAATDILKKSPLTGTGLMGFHEAYKNYPLGPDRVVQNYPHNFFLNFWTETGLLGLVAIVGLLIIFYRKIYLLLKSPSPNPSPQGRGIKTSSSPLRGEDKGGGEISKSYALAAAAGMTMIILHGLVDVSYFKNDLSILFWLIYSLPFLSLQAKREEAILRVGGSNDKKNALRTSA